MNGIELQYMLKYMLNYIVRAREVIAIYVGVNLTLTYMRKPDNLTKGCFPLSRFSHARVRT